MLKQWIKTNYIYMILAGVHTALSFFTDQFAFDYRTDLSGGGIGRLVFYKLLLFAALTFFYRFCGTTIKRYQTGDSVYRLQVKIGAVYFAVMFVFFIITWPGVWRFDELLILENNYHLQLDYWQHYFTSIYYIVCMMAIPFPAGIVFFQIIIISCAVAYIFIQAYQLLNQSNAAYLVLVPFFFISMIDTNLYPLRMSIYTYLVVILFLQMILIAKDEVRYSTKGAVLLALLVAVVGLWRTESMVFLVTIPVSLWLIGRKKYAVKQQLVFLICFILLAAGLAAPQQLGTKKQSNDEYEITGIIMPLTAVIKPAYSNSADAQLLNDINKVLDVEKLKDSEDGIVAFWHDDVVRYDYNREEYQQFLESGMRLITKYPTVFVKERLYVFMKASAMTENSNPHVGNSAGIFEEQVERYVTFRNRYLFNLPIFPKIRSAAIHMLEGRHPTRIFHPIVTFRIFYNLLPAILTMIILMIGSVIKKNLAGFLVSVNILGLSLLVLITAPGIYFMYYLPIYLTGYLCLFGWIAWKIEIKRKIRLG